MNSCDNEKNCVGLAVIRESISNLRLVLDSFREDIKSLIADNLKRHEEIRDCFYLAETTGKKLEELSESVETELELSSTRLTKKVETEYAEYIAIRAEMDKIRERISLVENTNERKTILIYKIVLPFVLGVLSVFGVYKWPF